VREQAKPHPHLVHGLTNAINMLEELCYRLEGRGDRQRNCGPELNAERTMKVTWEHLGCPDGPGTYPFKDSTINVTQQARSTLHCEQFPPVDW
jgi:hypothetical protein